MSKKSNSTWLDFRNANPSKALSNVPSNFKNGVLSTKPLTLSKAKGSSSMIIQE
jgi:hypothetical protein